MSQLMGALKRRWQAFMKDEPGRRFQDRHARAHRNKRGILHRVLYVGGGILVFALGIFFLPAPGPGMVIVLIGLGMIAQESLAMAKALDRVELWLRRVLRAAQRRWKSMPAAGRASVIALGVALIAGFAYASYVIVLG